MKITVSSCLDGARSAKGLTVIIDVFRAFSFECTAYALGAERIIAVGALDEAYALGREHPEYILTGERGGARCEGFACGNSPSELGKIDIRGRTIVHTTSAGTQGIANAEDAGEILAGALVNAAATARYIRARGPEEVTLVGMGLGGNIPSEEDMLCAEYIKALLMGEEPDIRKKAERLWYTSGAKFFDERQQASFPRADFPICVDIDRHPFVLRARKAPVGWDMIKADVPVHLENQDKGK